MVVVVARAGDAIARPVFCCFIKLYFSHCVRPVASQ